MIQKAQEACKNAGEKVIDHFPNVRKTVSIGSGAEKEIDDNSAVRDLLITRGIIPENLPPEGDVKKLQRKLKGMKGKSYLRQRKKQNKELRIKEGRFVLNEKIR